MNDSDSSSNSKKESLRILIIGLALCSSYVLIMILAGYPFLVANANTQEAYTFIYMVFLCTAGIMTSFHLWSRVPLLPKNTSMRNLFRTIGFTFLPTFLIFSIQTIDTILDFNSLPTLFGSINQAIGTIKFNFFGLEQYKTTMPADSLVIFEFIIISIMCYIYPMERFVDKKPWRVLALLIVLIFLPLAPFIVSAGASDVVISIFTATIVLYVVYCFFYLFYLYFSTAMKASGTVKQGGIMIAFGLLLLIITWMIGWALPLISEIDAIATNILQYGLGALSLILFNRGFYILRPS